MAKGFITFGLGAVGSLLGGPLGGFIGSTLGSFIDNQLFPAKQEGPRLEDLRVTTSTYGKAIPRLYGPECRMAPNIIWSTGLIETKKKTKQGGKGTPTVEVTEYTYSTSVAFVLSARQVQGVFKIMANGKVIYDSSGTDLGSISDLGDGKQAVFQTLRVYPGTFTQDPDPTIEAHLGVGNTPAYRGTAYCVIENWQLADYGNRIPNIEIFVQADDEIRVGEVVQDIVAACGVDPLLVSVRPGALCRGYIIGNASSGIGALQPLAMAFDFDVAEVAGGLRIIGRGQGPAASIESWCLGGRVPTSPAGPRLTYSRAPETEMPREASFSFMDPERDYQINTQTAVRAAGSADNNLQASVPIVLDVDWARRRVDRLLWEAWSSRKTGRANSDDRLIGLEPGRLYCFETAAGLEPLRLVRRTRGADGVLELELKRDRPEVYESTAQGTSAPTPPNELRLPGPTLLQLLDAPILQDSDDDTGFYAVVVGPESGWRGADLRRSVDGGTTYDQVEPIGVEANIGTADALAATQAETWDEVSVLTVTLLDTTQALESLTEAEVLAGGNAAWLGPESGQGGEIVQWRDALETSPGVWELRGLLRGRLGTEHAMDHPDGDTFVLLEPGALTRIDYGPADWNRERQYRAVSLLTDEDDAAVETFTNTGEGKRPLSPVHLTPGTDGSDITLSWIRRSRLRAPGLGNGPVPLGEDVEAYEVEVLDGVTVVRTISTSTPSLVYAAADIAADGFGSSDTVGFRVYQLSGVRGRGRPALASQEVP